MLKSRVTKAPKVALSVLGLFGLAVILPDILPLQDPLRIDLPDRLQPPMWYRNATIDHPLGTDALGRDVASRLIYGARISAFVGLSVVAVSAVVGTFFGVVAGYFGRLVDTITVRVIDATLTIPIVLIGIITYVIMGPGTLVLVISLGFFLWGRFARVVRGEALRLREEDFIKRARIVGGVPRMLLRHLTPNLMNTVYILATVNLGLVVVAEASLSFLGLGLPPPAPSWGNMVAEGRDYLREAWWLALFPGGAIASVVLAFSAVGDWLRDRSDPYSGVSAQQISGQSAEVSGV